MSNINEMGVMISSGTEVLENMLYRIGIIFQLTNKITVSY